MLPCQSHTRLFLRGLSVWALSLALATPLQAEVKFEAVELAAGIEHPWGLAITPSGAMFIGSRSGAIYRLGTAGNLSLTTRLEVSTGGQGGLLDFELHPDFAEQPYLYASASYARGRQRGTRLLRARVDDSGGLSAWRALFEGDNLASGGRHFGARLLFDRAGNLYMGLGDRGDRPRAQDLRDHAGTILRLDSNGAPVADNPFPENPAVYSYGHRNIQGMALHPDTGRVWAHEHGPRGGDEVNLIAAGANYGWPLVTYGVAYSGFKIGEGTHKAGTEQPKWYWVPSIAPSGMAFYHGEQFPEWQGDLLVGALVGRALVRLELDGDQVIAEHRMLEGELGRIRTVRVHDGEVYLLTDANNGKLYRLRRL